MSPRGSQRDLAIRLSEPCAVVGFAQRAASCQMKAEVGPDRGLPAGVGDRDSVDEALAESCSTEQSGHDLAVGMSACGCWNRTKAATSPRRWPARPMRPKSPAHHRMRPGNAPCKNARPPMQSRPGRSGTRAPPTDPQLAPLVTGMSPFRSCGCATGGVRKGSSAIEALFPRLAGLGANRGEAPQQGQCGARFEAAASVTRERSADDMAERHTRSLLRESARDQIRRHLLRSAAQGSAWPGGSGYRRSRRSLTPSFCIAR